MVAPGIDGGFVDAGVVDGEALATEERDVASDAQVVGNVELEERGADVGLRVGLRGGGAIVHDRAEEVFLGLIKRGKASREAVGADFIVGVGLAADVVGVLMPRCGDRQVGWE